MKFIKIKIKIYFYTLRAKFLKFREKSDRGGMLCPWGRKMGFGHVFDASHHFAMRARITRSVAGVSRQVYVIDWYYVVYVNISHYNHL
jgi:hypothetical protein